MEQRKIIGIVLIIISVSMLLFLFAAYSIANFVVSNVETLSDVNNPNLNENIANDNSSIAITNESADDNLSSAEVKSEIYRIINTAITVLSIPGIAAFLIGLYLLIKGKKPVSVPPQSGTKL
ncbi:MAG: hypothetical protein NT116_04195 [Candidatus Parcubacteria bacterium]|nr:hypothetical protein [Candidatus Parcubacteria bacterium]